MHGELEFLVLGPLQVRLDGTPVPIPAAKQRTLLAALLADANRVVSIGELTQRLWDGDPPERARRILHTYVMRLRNVLRTDAALVPIVTHPDGYEIRVRHEAFDLLRFESLLREASSPAVGADAGQRSALLTDALALWHGEPLANVASRVLHQQIVPVWSEQRLAALEQRIDADLDLGRGAELLPELRELTVRHPLRERFWAQRMLALYRSGRAAEALDCFREVSTHLAEELGIDPGPGLRAVHQAVLTNDPALLWSAPVRRSVDAGAPDESHCPGTPPSTSTTTTTNNNNDNAAVAAPVADRGRNDLPAGIVDFAGREAELLTLSALFRDSASDGRAVLISAIDGMGGVGKTALAVHAAHRAAEHYPDAQLFLDLHGHTPYQAPLEPKAALETLLRALGIAAAEIPAGLDERAARWRAELAGRRVLLVLDNASGAAQVRPLLPGTPDCLVLITSRRRLVDLETARTISLDVLTEQDALTLFTSVVGSERTDAEPEAVAEILRLCGHLPLAVRIAAARLRSRATWTVAHLARRLRDACGRLSELDTGERGVAATFELSHRYLDETSRRLFRLLGLLPGGTFDAYLAAALAEMPVRQAERVLEELVDVHLAELVGTDRYRFHDLVRDHARAEAERAESTQARHEALSRALDYYIHVAQPLGTVLSPHHEHVAPQLDYPPAEVPELAGGGEVRAWFDAEYLNLDATVLYARDHAADRQCWQLVHAVWPYYREHGVMDQWFVVLRAALAAATRDGQVKARADSLRYLGIASWEAGRYADAIDHYHLALDSYRAAGDLRGEAACAANIGMVLWRLEHLEQALEHQHRALSLYAEIGADWGQAVALINIALVYGELDRHRESLDCNLRALAVFRRLGDPAGEAGTLSNIGQNYRNLARYGEAVTHQREAVALAVRHGAGKKFECELRNDLADTYLAAADAAAAHASYAEGLRLAEAVHDPFEEARSHNGLGDAAVGSDPREAVRHWHQALDLYERMGLTQADHVRKKLAEIAEIAEIDAV